MVAQLALTVVLLTAAGLLWRNFVVQYRADLGVDPRHLITLSIELPVQRSPTTEPGLLIMVAVVATLPPARRAARVDPMSALRAD